MARIFTRKQFSNYLGETRAINDIITKWTYVCPSELTIVGTGGALEYSGTYERLVGFDGYMTDNGTTRSYHQGQYPGDGRTYSVYGRQDGNNFYTLVFTSGLFSYPFYRIYKSLYDYIVIDGTYSTSVGLSLSGSYNSWIDSLDGVWYPIESDEYLTNTISLTYTLPCPPLPEPIDTSERWTWYPPNTTNTGYTNSNLSWFTEQRALFRPRLILINGPVIVPDYGGGVYFDGANDSAQFYKANPIEDFYPNTSIFTLSFWWEPHDTYVGYQRLVSTGNQKFEIACNNLNISWYSPANSWNTFTQTTNVINQPALFTMTYDGTNLKYYRNGILQDTDSATIDLSSNVGVVSIASLSFNADWYESTWYRINVYDEVKDADFILNYFNETKSQYGY